MLFYENNFCSFHSGPVHPHVKPPPSLPLPLITSTTSHLSLPPFFPPSIPFSPSIPLSPPPSLIPSLLLPLPLSPLLPYFPPSISPSLSPPDSFFPSSPSTSLPPSFPLPPLPQHRITNNTVPVVHNFDLSP